MFHIRIIVLIMYHSMSSVLWRCWLGDRNGIWPVKKWWRAGIVICLERDADLHMAQLMPLSLTVSCFSKIQIGYTFLVPARPGSPGQMAVKRCVTVCCLICSDRYISRHYGGCVFTCLVFVSKASRCKNLSNNIQLGLICQELLHRRSVCVTDKSKTYNTIN